MLKEERQQYIMSCLSENQRVYITTLSDELHVSDDTLRRDLIELDALGLVTKVHGGAISKSGISYEFANRIQRDMDRKRALAAKVVPFFRSGDIIIIDGGTSNLEVVRQLPADLKLTN